MKNLLTDQKVVHNFLLFEFKKKCGKGNQRKNKSKLVKFDTMTSTKKNQWSQNMASLVFSWGVGWFMVQKKNNRKSNIIKSTKIGKNRSSFDFFLLIFFFIYKKFWSKFCVYIFVFVINTKNVGNVYIKWIPKFLYPFIFF